MTLKLLIYNYEMPNDIIKVKYGVKKGLWDIFKLFKCKKYIH